MTETPKSMSRSSQIVSLSLVFLPVSLFPLFFPGFLEETEEEGGRSPSKISPPDSILSKTLA